MQHPGTHDVIERAPQRLNVLDRKLVEIEILQGVLSLEITRVTQARFADVDGGDASVGLAQRVPGRLGCAAPGDEDLLASAYRFRWPEEVKQRPATVRIAVQVAVLIEAGEGRRVRPPLVEGVHLLRDRRVRRLAVRRFAHSHQALTGDPECGRGAARRASGSPSPRLSVLLTGGRELLHDLVDAEAGRLLARREVLEAGDPPGDEDLSRHEQEDAPG